MRNNFSFTVGIVVVGLVCMFAGSASLAVNSKITRHSSSSDLLKGITDNVVIDSRGTIKLGRATQEVIKDFGDFDSVWSINSIVVNGGTIYFGTSPNGGIYKFRLNTLTRIYPQPDGSSDVQADDEEQQDDESDYETVKAEEYLSNEHIFAMATDVSGRLLAGISGRECKLCRFENNTMEVVFEPNDAKYIFAITVDDSGYIYLGTGPEGKIYKLNPFAENPQVIFDSPDKNILSLASGDDGCVYAGSDTRGLIYKINTRTEKTTVLYDSEQPEITALLFVDSAGSEGSSGASGSAELYAAGTSAKVVQAQAQYAASVYEGSSAGRPEIEEPDEKSYEQSEGGRTLQVANSQKSEESPPSQSQPQTRKRPQPSKASFIYRITKDGFVNDVFNEAAVFFCLAQQDEKLLVGTGNGAQLFSIDPAMEQRAIIYEDKQSSQITTVTVAGKDIYIGTANPAKLMKLTGGFAIEGEYVSSLIDAGQPSNWGKLQLEADIPNGCEVLAAVRSGNVEDVNDSTFSGWSEPVEVTRPVQLDCPTGRFCQYKLILRSENGDRSPTVREIAVANTVPNLAPRIELVTVNRIMSPAKHGFFKISYKAEDENEDQLVYKIDFRKDGWRNWIQMKDKLTDSDFEWDARTVEDGRYEIRVTASDEKSNTTAGAMTGSRISDTVVVDNTGPEIKKMKMTTVFESGSQYKTFAVEVSDELSAIGRLEYTIDSNSDWMGAVPDDLVYDTMQENFTIDVDTEDGLSEGDHVLAIRVSDAVRNATYKTIEFSVD